MKITRFEEFLEKSVPYFIAVVFLIILLVMGSCNDRKLQPVDGIGHYEIEIVDGCEYLVSTSIGYSGYVTKSITHKGNCKNHKPCE